MNNTNMTLEQARNTLWPFRDIKGRSMGMLFDAGLITRKDLEYAVQRAYDPQVRAAAKVLLINQLEQIAAKSNSDAGFIEVISSGRSFSQRRQMFYNLVQGMFFGGAFGLSLGWTIAYLIYRDTPEIDPQRAAIINQPIYILAAIAILIVAGIVIIALINIVMSRVSRYFDRLIDQHRKGQQGEERAVSVIQQTLDGKWKAFLNVSLPGRNPADLDVVLVGPAGVYALEVKNFSGTFRNIGNAWEYRTKRGWQKLGRSPSDQATKNASRLNDFLKADGISQYVEKAVVWANPDAPFTTENPTVRVWTLERLRDELGNLPQTDKVSPTTRDQIVAKLSKLCEKQADEQWYAK